MSLEEARRFLATLKTDKNLFTTSSGELQRAVSLANEISFRPTRPILWGARNIGDFIAASGFGCTGTDLGAALFVRSLRNVEGLDIGYDADRLIFGSVEFEKGQAPPDAVVAAATDQVAVRLASRPGIERVARAGMPPMTGFSFGLLFTDEGSVGSSSNTAPTFAVVSADYFATVGMRLLRGSTFDDRPGAPPAVVVNDAMARTVWPG